tara:strand:- start:867 stop:1034 length:168 start_codon:yes stop_codon:yes gene_type:complete
MSRMGDKMIEIDEWIGDQLEDQKTSDEILALARTKFGLSFLDFVVDRLEYGSEME